MSCICCIDVTKCQISACFALLLSVFVLCATLKKGAPNDLKIKLKTISKAPIYVALRRVTSVPNPPNFKLLCSKTSHFRITGHFWERYMEWPQNNIENCRVKKVINTAEMHYVRSVMGRRSLQDTSLSFGYLRNIFQARNSNYSLLFASSPWAKRHLLEEECKQENAEAWAPILEDLPWSRDIQYTTSLYAIRARIAYINHAKS